MAASPPRHYPAHELAFDGNLSGLATALTRNPKCISERDSEGRQPLHLAAQAGHASIVKFLLANNADVDAVTTRGATPLFVACLFGQVGVVEVLVKKGGADTSIKNKDGKWPLEVVCQLASHLDDNQKKNVTAEIKALLMGKPRPIPEEEQGQTLFDLAADGDLEEVTNFVTRHPMTLTQTDSDGRTALHFAAQGGYPEILDYLIRQGGCEVEARTTSKGSTPLHVALMLGKFEAAEILLRVGKANPETKNNEGRTPLDLNCSYASDGDKANKEALEALVQGYIAAAEEARAAEEAQKRAEEEKKRRSTIKSTFTTISTTKDETGTYPGGGKRGSLEDASNPLPVPTTTAPSTTTTGGGGSTTPGNTTPTPPTTDILPPPPPAPPLTIKSFLLESGLSDGQVEFLTEALKGDGLRSIEDFKGAVGVDGEGGRLKESDLSSKYGLSKKEAREVVRRLRGEPPTPVACCTVS